MPYREFLPDARLRGLVRVYWQVEEFHDVGQQEHMFMPERSVRLTFYAGDSWQSLVQGGELERMPGATLYGLSLTPQRVVSHGLTRALGVELYPWGARQLLGWSMGQQEMNLGLSYGRASQEICALLTLNDWEGARQRLEHWLLTLWQERAGESGKGVVAATQLYLTLGTAKIGTLAEELNLSQRQLERQFVQQVGVNAKTLARLIRFEEVHNRLWVDAGVSLAELSYELGFADQAHLTREFRTLSGVTPKSFAQFAQLRKQMDTQEAHLIDPATLDLSAYSTTWPLTPASFGQDGR